MYAPRHYCRLQQRNIGAVEFGTIQLVNLTFTYGPIITGHSEDFQVDTKSDNVMYEDESSCLLHTGQYLADLPNKYSVYLAQYSHYRR